jgi:hypothetical protein
MTVPSLDIVAGRMPIRVESAYPRTLVTRLGRGLTVANRRNAVTDQVTGWLQPRLEPGDRFVAGAFGESGPMRRWEWPVMLAAVAAFVIFLGLALDSLAKTWQDGWLAYAWAAPAAVVAVVASRRKPTYAAVTNNHVYFIRMTSTGRSPSRVLFRVPLTAVQVTTVRRSRWQRVLRFDGPGFARRGTYLITQGNWRFALDPLLSALRVGGAATGPRPSQTAPLAAADERATRSPADETADHSPADETADHSPADETADHSPADETADHSPADEIVQAPALVPLPLPSTAANPGYPATADPGHAATSTHDSVL